MHCLFVCWLGGRSRGDGEGGGKEGRGVVLVAGVCCLQSRFPESPISSHLGEPGRVAREIVNVAVASGWL